LLAAAIPREPELKPAAVILSLPAEIDGWSSETMKANEEERGMLAKDTQFEKRRYWRTAGRGNAHESVEALREIHASIVLSGHDLNGSIHRPERCLVSQGFSGLESKSVELDVGGGKKITVKRVISHRSLTSEDGEDFFEVPHLAYYWFVGHDSITEDHFRRTYLDMRGRLLGGYNQRWSYFLISTSITSGLPDPLARDEARTEEEMREIAAEIYRSCVRREMIGG